MVRSQMSVTNGGDGGEVDDAISTLSPPWFVAGRSACQRSGSGLSFSDDSPIISNFSFDTDGSDDATTAAKALIVASTVRVDEVGAAKSKRRPVRRKEDPIPVPPTARPRSAMALLARIYSIDEKDT